MPVEVELIDQAPNEQLVNDRQLKTVLELLNDSKDAAHEHGSVYIGTAVFGLLPVRVRTGNGRSYIVHLINSDGAVVHSR